MKYIIITLIVLSVLIAGCAKTVYICPYGGEKVKDPKLCPLPVNPTTSKLDAERSLDTYGHAVGSANDLKYTRVSTFVQNATWHANVLFTDDQQHLVNKAVFKVNDKTGDVICVSGCDVLGDLQ